MHEARASMLWHIIDHLTPLFPLPLTLSLLPLSFPPPHPSPEHRAGERVGVEATEEEVSVIRVDSCLI
jgi:hypothetical protein